MIKFLNILFTIVISASLACSVSAQNNDATLNVVISPNNPKPEQEILLTLESHSLDLNKSRITWQLNGEEKQTSIGGKKLYLLAGQSGRLMSVKAIVEVTPGQTIEKQVSIIPAGVDLIYESITYTPPFYKGKALNTNQSDVVVVAFPEFFDSTGRKYSTTELFFSWEKDGIIDLESSGLNKNYFIYSQPIPPRDFEVRVTVKNKEGNVAASESVLISKQEPELVFYEESPIFGIMFNRAISNTVNLSGGEFSAIAIPYYFSTGQQNSPNLQYSWSINSTRAAPQDPNNSFTVRQETPGTGTARIDLKVSNLIRIFQYQSRGFNINFSKE